MHPSKVNRQNLSLFTDLPNIGPAMAGDLKLLGYKSPSDLCGEDAWEMFNRLCKVTGVTQDPCVMDVFLSITRFMAGEAPRPWWDYTEERKELMKVRQRDPLA